MKLLNISLAIVWLLGVFSCSMEDDTIMNDMENSIEETTGEMYTAINFGLEFTEMATKSTSVEGGGFEPAEGDSENRKEKTISSFDIFLLENNKIIGIIRNNAQIAGEDINDIKLKSSEFITKYKIGRILNAYIVVNATVYGDADNNIITYDPFSSVKIGDDKDQINQQISDHLTAESLIKVGDEIITIDDTFPKESSPKVFTKDCQPKNIKVTVSHVAARLDFSKFSCTLNGFSEGATVKLVSAEFRNIQNKGYINGEEYSTFSPVDAVALENEMTVAGSINPKLRAYSYRSQSLTKDGHEQHVELFVKFEVKDNSVTKTFEKAYTINPPASGKNVDHNYVMGGYLYNIEVNWTITPTWADSSIEFYTRDWESNDLGNVIL